MSTYNDDATIFEPITGDADLCEQIADRMVHGESFALMTSMSENNADDFIAMARGIAAEVRQSTGDEWNVSSVIDPNERTVQVDFVPVMVVA